jgi:hypothetical protein
LHSRRSLRASSRRTRALETHLGIHTKCKPLLATAEAILLTPIPSAAFSDLEIEAATVEVSARPAQRAELEIGQRHAGGISIEE